jgi:hypothetical protein
MHLITILHCCCLLLMQLHWENKHTKLPFDESACEDLHAKVGGVTTQGVAVQGSKKKK